MKRLYVSILLLITILLLCGCGVAAADPSSAPTQSPEAEESAAPVEEPTPEPEPTPTPIPEITFPDGTVYRADETELDLSKLTHKDVAAVVELLKEMPNLKKLDLGSDGAWSRQDQAELNAETAAIERPEAATRDLSWSDLRKLPL